MAILSSLLTPEELAKLNEHERANLEGKITMQLANPELHKLIGHNVQIDALKKHTANR